MNDSDKIRSVVARFFAVTESTVTEAFEFPRDRLQGSVGRTTLHAALKRMAGADLPSAFTANTFGELVGTTPLVQDGTKASEERAGAPASSSRAPSVERNGAKSLPGPPSSVGLGIDIESADNLPWSGVPRSEPFYVENFTGAEIAYCVRQADPRLSFCGLWCAKEAAIKCGRDFAGLRPIEIEIHHDETGRPMLQKAGAAHSASDCQVSISHAGRTCVAVCLQVPPVREAMPSPLLATNGATRRSGDSFDQLLLWLSLALSLFSAFLWVLRWIRR